jgi:hypothetical protein
MKRGVWLFAPRSPACMPTASLCGVSDATGCYEVTLVRRGQLLAACCPNALPPVLGWVRAGSGEQFLDEGADGFDIGEQVGSDNMKGCRRWGAAIG